MQIYPKTQRKSLLDSRGKFFYYEDYVYKLVNFTEQHIKDVFKVNVPSREKEASKTAEAK